MSSTGATRLTLEFDRAREPIRGRIGLEGGREAHEFVGWLDLAAALGDLLDKVDWRSGASYPAHEEDAP